MTSEKTYFYCDLDTPRGEEDLAWEKFIKLVDCAVTGKGDEETVQALKEWKERNRLEVPEPLLTASEQQVAGFLERLADDFEDELGEEVEEIGIHEIQESSETEQELDSDTQQSNAYGDRDYEALYDELLSIGAGEGNIWHGTPPRRNNLQSSVPFAPIKETNAKSTLGDSQNTGLPKLLSQRGGFYSPRPAQKSKAERFKDRMCISPRKRLTRSESTVPRDIREELARIARTDSSGNIRED
jgi:hypothetical protein